jgi:hypothetical protein
VAQNLCALHGDSPHILSNLLPFAQNTDVNVAEDLRNTAAPASSDTRVGVLTAFLHRLSQRYESWQRARPAGLDEATIESRLMSLDLAEAALRLHTRHAFRPPQIAVMGPTQTGKSTVANLLLGGDVADVSPLAGFTVHAQGFAIDSDPDATWTSALFPGWQRVRRPELSRDDLHAWSLSRAESTVRHLPPCVVWDTPDFDSLSSPLYRRAVLEMAALADVIVLVVSKEKYADLSVWRMLRLLAPLGCPLLVCINKLTPDSSDAITTAMREKLAESPSPNAAAPIVRLPYSAELSAASSAAEQSGSELWAAIARELRNAPTDRQANVAALFRAHWDDWLSPLAAERAAIEQWNGHVRSALDSAVKSYEAEYLEHPERYDAFRRATIELLNLLEIPGVGGVLGKVRNVVTWPARRIFSAGREWLQRRAAGSPPRRTGEEAVLDDLIERVLTGLLREAVRATAAPSPAEGVWRALADRLERDQPRLRESFAARARAVRESFASQIHAAANRLFELLKERPALLAALRAARATTDLASIAFAIKTGGAHINDLLLAPATFAISSLLTEGALGGYMGRVRDDLKRRQLDHTRTELFDEAIAVELRRLAATLDDERLFGIDPREADHAGAALADWERQQGRRDA